MQGLFKISENRTQDTFAPSGHSKTECLLALSAIVLSAIGVLDEKYYSTLCYSAVEVLNLIVQVLINFV